MGYAIGPFDLKLPEKKDKFNLERYVVNNWKIISENLLPMEVITKAQYDSITHISNKIYFVDEGETISVYINNKQTNKTNPLDTLCGKIEISVTTETNAVYAPIHGGKRNIIGAVTTLRNVYNGANLEDFEPPNVQVYSVLYQGSLCALLKCPSGNIPKGTYYVDWKATEVS